MRLPVVAICLFSSLALAGEATLPTFRADTFTRTEDGRVVEGRVWSSGNRVRREVEGAGKKITSIFDLEEKLVWLVLPPPLRCVEAPLVPQPTDPLLRSGVTREEKTGEGSVDGRVVDLYRTTIDHDGRRYVFEESRARDLDHLVIRSKADAGPFEMRYENIVEGVPKADLFEPPKGCSRLEQATHGHGHRHH